MISLRKHIEDHSGQLAKAAVSAYKGALEAMAKAGTQAIPPLGSILSVKFSSLCENLSETAGPNEIADAQSVVAEELDQWGESAAKHFREKAKEVREIMMAVAASAEALGERDHRYSGQFNGLTTKLQSIARLEDLSAMRRSVMESANELRTAVKKMAEEGAQATAALRAEVETYRTKLALSEKREAIDSLTNLANRREIEVQIEDRIMWKRPFCLAILDLDGFKAINDIHGHVAGDDLLKQFAAELKSQFRPRDVVGRWGGDEFVLIVDSDIEEAHARMVRVRQWVFGDYKINSGREVVEVVMRGSIGIAEWDGKESDTELMARADERMYAEKKVRSMPRVDAA